MIDELLTEHMDQMDLDGLYKLNEDVVRRIRQLQAANNRRLATNFEIGDRVEWHSRKKGRGTIMGTVEKVNIKTLGVLTDDGVKWRVALSLCEKI